jgi:hypothetical protein
MIRMKQYTRLMRASVAIGALAIAMASPKVFAGPQHGNNGGDELDNIRRVLLISVDGLHAIDYENCSKGLPGVNGGAPYCPNLGALGTTSINYLDTSTSKPSDSFPGLMALMTGASPRTMGVNYDVAYDRALNPPMDTSGNGNPAGPCTVGGSPSGTTTEYDEGIENNQNVLNGGATSGDGGVSAINPNFLVRDQNCLPVYPWNFIRTNTIFGVIHRAGDYTAWSDKHASYSSVGGPTGTTTDTNVDDYYSPEINSNSQDFEAGAFPSLIIPACKPNLPDSAAVNAGDDYTGSFQNIQCYDSLKAQAILNEIDGKNHDGSAREPVPNIFGMNFQAVSIGQKLIYQHGAVAPGYSVTGGYLDSIGTPSPSLLKEIEFVDSSIGQMAAALKARHLIDSTLIIVTAKHGQSPVDSSRYVRDGSHDPATILSSCLDASENSAIGPTEDDVALLWLDQTIAGCDTASAVAALEAASPVTNNIAGIGVIFSGPGIGLYYNASDSRAPDILITPNIGVTYSNSKKKLAEHGGFSHDDTNVIMLLSNPSLSPLTVTTPVQTADVAPTILEALGLNPQDLQAVQIEHTPALPGLSFN